MHLVGAYILIEFMENAYVLYGIPLALVGILLRNSVGILMLLFGVVLCMV